MNAKINLLLKRSAFESATLAVILICCMLALSSCEVAKTKPNVILLMADDMGWAQTGYYGHPLMKTPNLDAMARNGLRMDRFYAGAPSCTPTRASVLTGRTNDRTGAFRVGSYINKQEKTLSTAFRNAGYATAHFGKWHLNGQANDDTSHPLPGSDPHNPGELGFDYWLSNHTGFDKHKDDGGTFELSRNGKREQFVGDGSEVIVSEAIKFIENELDAGEPFFIVIWYSAPHGPWTASDSDIAPFLGKVDRTSANMHGEIVAMDRSIGSLKQGLRDLRIAENTLIWFTSDNGGTANVDAKVLPETKMKVKDASKKGPNIGVTVEYPSNCSDEIDPDLTSLQARKLHGCYRGVDPDSTGHLRGFKKDFYEGGLRVPTVIEWPAGIKPRVSNFPSGTVDIFPTLIDIANLDPQSINEVHDGISLAQVFENEPRRRDKPMGFRANQGRMWLDNDWKLIQNVETVDGAWVTKSFELYNVIGDPSEQQNLIELYPEVAKRLRDAYDQWSLSVSRSAFGADYPEGKVLPAGRELIPGLEAQRKKAMARWEEEIRLSEITVLQ